MPSQIFYEALSQLLKSLGVSYDEKHHMDYNDWKCYSLNHNSKSKAVPILLVESGPKNIADLKRAAKPHTTCVIISTQLGKIFLKTLTKTYTASLDTDMDYSRITEVIRAQNVSAANSETVLNAYLENVIDAIPSTEKDFENRGLFSTHYLRNRIFDDAPDVDIGILRKAGTDVNLLLGILGWKIKDFGGVACVKITTQENFSIRESRGGTAPSYSAVSEMKRYRWVILTNGSKWRLYTSRVSASSTNYFEINLNEPSDSVLRYLGIIFGRDSFEGDSPRIDLFFDKGREFATQLEENLASKIMDQNGILLNLAKGILNHDMKKTFDGAELASAKETALRVIYRVWFIAYAESRNLLPVSDVKYGKMSLRNLHNNLDSYESDDKKDTCWKYLLKLFNGIRKGSPEDNLPQYNGNLFSHDIRIDGISIDNKWAIPAIRDMLERDGDAIDYASLGVRHLGNILENVMEYSIQQADQDIMLLVKGGKITQVKTSKESNYSYGKNDLYLASKGGIAVRKGTASYYTPDEIVKFLVNRGLEPILEERSARMAEDVESYIRKPSPQTRKRCMERLLDIQVLDPTMGSGHFLVEALNRLTSWATETLREYPKHPLLEELERDRGIILDEQEKRGITINENLLTHDILLKRKIMKRCIFGVDLNPMAVEIAKLALWLDSFAIGVPLTYMDHHIKSGDSTIGMFLGDLEDKNNHSLDDWTPSQESKKLLEDVSSSSDVTISQVHQSEDRYKEYVESISSQTRILDALTASKITDIIPKKSTRRSEAEFIYQFGRYGKNEAKELHPARKKVADLSKRYRFFHWELEMRDAFTDLRRGFDVILGNPPWDKVKPSVDEFFTPYHPAFKGISTKQKKNHTMKKILEDKDIRAKYDSYLNEFKEKSRFYSLYSKQGSGHKDLSKLILEKSLGLLSDGGIISMVLPSQILSSTGSAGIRGEILDRDISQLYVFENRKKIFNIDSRYRFMLLTMRNSSGGDEFPTGFYLHNLQSLNNNTLEQKKFGSHSKKQIRQMFPESLLISESTGEAQEIFAKVYKLPKLGDGLGNGVMVSFSSGFHKTNDSDLFREDGMGWPLLEGKTIHQYSHVWSKPEFTVSYREGLERENKPKYSKMHREFYNSYRLVFRDVSRSTDMRTTIAAIVPPRTFLAQSANYIMLKQNDILLFNDTYLSNILYLCGVFNSTPFDFVSRQLVQIHLTAVMPKMPISPPSEKLTLLAAKLTVGHDSFEGLASHMRIPNEYLSVSERIDTAAELDVLVAKSYGLSKSDYGTILESFTAFRENPDLRHTKEITWNNQNLKEFYGEMAKKALEIF